MGTKLDTMLYRPSMRLAPSNWYQRAYASTSFSLPRTSRSSVLTRKYMVPSEPSSKMVSARLAWASAFHTDLRCRRGEQAQSSNRDQRVSLPCNRRQQRRQRVSKHVSERTCCASRTMILRPLRSTRWPTLRTMNMRPGLGSWPPPPPPPPPPAAAAPPAASILRGNGRQERQARGASEPTLQSPPGRRAIARRARLPPRRRARAAATDARGPQLVSARRRVPGRGLQSTAPRGARGRPWRCGPRTRALVRRARPPSRRSARAAAINEQSHQLIGARRCAPGRRR